MEGLYRSVHGPHHRGRSTDTALTSQGRNPPYLPRCESTRDLFPHRFLMVPTLQPRSGSVTTRPHTRQTSPPLSPAVAGKVSSPIVRLRFFTLCTLAPITYVDHMSVINSPVNEHRLTCSFVFPDLASILLSPSSFSLPHLRLFASRSSS